MKRRVSCIQMCRFQHIMCRQLSQWEVPRNRLPPRHHSAEKQAAIRTQVNKLLEVGVIEESQASEWSQAHPVRSMAIDPRL